MGCHRGAGALTTRPSHHQGTLSSSTTSSSSSPLTRKTKEPGDFLVSRWARGYLPASLRRLFLTGGVSHRQPNISRVSSPFVFIPQQAAPVFATTLTSRRSVFSPTSGDFRRLSGEKMRDGVRFRLCQGFFSLLHLLLMVNDQANVCQSLVYGCVQQ